LREAESGLGNPLAVDPVIRMQLRQDRRLADDFRSLEEAEQMAGLLDSVESLASRLVAQLTVNDRHVVFSEVVEAILHLSRMADGLTTFLHRDVEAALTSVHLLAAELTIVCNAASDAARTLETVRRPPRRSSKSNPGRLTVREAQRLLATALEDARGIAYPLLDRCVAARAAVHRHLLMMGNVIRRMLALQLGVPGSLPRQR
jgi:hypothetical protein